MSNTPFPSRQFCRPSGFTLVELMVGMGLSLLLLGLAFTLLDQLMNVSDAANSIADVNENLRASVNMIARDLSTAGAEIPEGGIPLPSGGSATPVSIPGPGTRTFNADPSACAGVAPCYITVLTPGPGLGPMAGTGPFPTPGAGSGPSGGSGSCPTCQYPTDVITVIGVDQSSNLDDKGLTGITILPTSVSITYPPGTLAAVIPPVLPGQLIMLENASVCIFAVSSVSWVPGMPPSTTPDTITFNQGDPTDVLGVNQFPGPGGPTTGTIGQIGPGGSAPVLASTSAFALNMFTYYLDNSTQPERVMRLVGSGCTNASPTTPTCPPPGTAGPQPVGMGISVMQFAYSLAPPASGLPTRIIPPVSSPSSSGPNTVRNVNLWMVAIADHTNRKSGLKYSNSIATSMVIQNLAYYNKY